MEIEKIVKHYGSEHQIVVAMEECGELIQSLSKYLRGEGSTDNIAEEMADVQLVLEELRFIFSISLNDTVKRMTDKIERTLDIIKLSEMSE